MKKLAVMGILFAGGIQAQECELSDCEICYETGFDCDSILQIGGNYTYVNLKVDDQPSFHGNLGGAQGSYEYRPADCFYGGVRVSWKQGKSESVGAHRSLVYVDVHERLGYTFATCERVWWCSLFSGFGFRYLGQKFEQSGQPSIKFDYNEFYIPVGFVSDYFFNSWFAAGLNFIWMPQVYPTVNIVPLKGARWILKYAISNVLVELPLTFFVDKCKRYSIIVKPFYEHWEDGKSIAKTATGNPLGLPENRYNFGGVEVSFAFSF